MASGKLWSLQVVFSSLPDPLSQLFTLFLPFPCIGAYDLAESSLAFKYCSGGCQVGHFVSYRLYFRRRSESSGTEISRHSCSWWEYCRWFAYALPRAFHLSLSCVDLELTLTSSCLVSITAQQTASLHYLPLHYQVRSLPPFPDDSTLTLTISSFDFVEQRALVERYDFLLDEYFASDLL